MVAEVAIRAPGLPKGMARNWLRRRCGMPILATDTLRVAFLCAAVELSLAADGLPQVFQFTQVNVDAAGNNIVGDAGNEPSLAVDPTAPNRMVIGWRQFDTIQSGFRQAGWAYSRDGGRSWAFPGAIEPGVYRSDPVLAADAEGDFYYASVTRNYPSFSDWRVHVFKSTDGGVTWGPRADGFGGDKPWMAIDPTDGIGRGNIYLTWKDPACCGQRTFSRSTDGGRSFGGPYWISPDIVARLARPGSGMAAVGPGGELYAAGKPAGGLRRQFVVVKSSNARDPKNTPVFDVVTLLDLGGSLIFTNSRFPSSPNSSGLLGQANLAVDHSHSATRGNVYLLLVKMRDPPKSKRVTTANRQGD